jgi:hypothetical protein
LTLSIKTVDISDMSTQSIDKPSVKSVAVSDPRVTDAIRRALGGVQFGSVEIVVHEGRVVQIERREKVRWDSVAGFAAS